MKTYRVTFVVEVEAMNQAEAGDIAWDEISNSPENVIETVELIHCPPPSEGTNE